MWKVGKKESAFLSFFFFERTGVTASRFHLLSRATRGVQRSRYRSFFSPDLDASAIFPLTFFLSFFPPRKEHAALRGDSTRYAPLRAYLKYLYIYIYLISSREKGAHLSNSAFRPRENFNFPSARTAFIFNRRGRHFLRGEERNREREKLFLLEIPRRDKRGETRREIHREEEGERKRGSRATSNRAGRIRIRR